MKDYGYRNKIAAALSAAKPQRGIEVQAFTKVSRDLYKVVATADTRTDETAFSEEVSKMVDGRAQFVPGSLARRGELCVAFVRTNVMTKPLDSSFAMVTASTAADASGRIWSVVTTDDGTKRVALEAGDDLEGIFKARMNARRSAVAPSQGAGLAVASFSNGDAVRYVDAETGSVKYGVALKSGGAVTVVGAETAAIDPLQVVSSAPKSALPKQLQVVGVPAMAALSPEKTAEVIDYLRKAYGEASGPMLDRLKQLTQKAA